MRNFLGTLYAYMGAFIHSFAITGLQALSKKKPFQMYGNNQLKIRNG